MEHQKDSMGLDEKENADRARGTMTVSAADAALTRRILLKLDFRYLCPRCPYDQERD
jgi:hypothetical protein